MIESSFWLVRSQLVNEGKYLSRFCFELGTIKYTDSLGSIAKCSSFFTYIASDWSIWIVGNKNSEACFGSSTKES